MTTVERIFQLIKDNNLTAKEFAYIIGVSQGNVTDWKTGRAKPSIESLKKICSAFNLNIDWLLGENSEREKENIDKYLNFPDDFKYYIEGLPECIIYRIKYVTYIILITHYNVEDVETNIDVELSVYKIPKKFIKDVKKSILYLYNYNIHYPKKNNSHHIDIPNHSEKNNELSSSLDSHLFMTPVYRQDISRTT